MLFKFTVALIIDGLWICKAFNFEKRFLSPTFPPPILLKPINLFWFIQVTQEFVWVGSKVTLGQEVSNLANSIRTSRDRVYNRVRSRPANSHGSAVSLTIFLSFLTVSRQGSSISRVLGKIILKWFKLLNQNKNGKLTRNACAINWKTNKEEHCSYFFVPSCVFRLCSINLIVFLRVCPSFWKGSRPWERGLIPRRLPWHLSLALSFVLVMTY